MVYFALPTTGDDQMKKETPFIMDDYVREPETITLSNAEFKNICSFHRNRGIGLGVFITTGVMIVSTAVTVVVMTWL
jgi:hypothetical protein